MPKPTNHHIESSPSAYHRSQVEVLGFGMELSDSLNRYATWKLSSDPSLNAKAKPLVEKHYLNWFLQCPNFDHVCFADITFFSPDHVSVRDALTILFTPEVENSQENHTEYVRILRDEYIQDGKGHTMAPHLLFAAGLPRLACPTPGLPPPEIDSELKPFFLKIRELDLAESITSGYFWKELSDIPSRKEPSAPTEALRYVAQDMKGPTYEKTDFTDAFAQQVSQEPISDQFERWSDIWAAHAQTMRSARGLPIRHIVAAPIGFRNPNDIVEYTLVACVFLALDTEMNEHDVIETLRYVFLHILEANATAWLLRKGDLIGRDAAVVPASHELTRVIGAIRPGASDSAYELIRTYFKQLLVDPSDFRAAARRQSSEPMASFGLHQIINDSLILASKVEAIIRMAEEETGSFARLSKDAFDSRVSSVVETVLKASKFSDNIRKGDVFCTAQHKHWFYLAVLGAIRNAIRHSILKEGQCFLFDVDASTAQTLVITNIINSSSVQRASEGSPTGGTLKALSGYVRGYGKDPRRVSLKRISVHQSGDPLLPHREEWCTVIPLPGNR